MAEIGTLARADAASRLRALTDLEATLLVEAGAGSGKTSVLAGRIALLLAAGRDPASIAAISFTEASASELRERLVSDHGLTPQTALAVAIGTSHGAYKFNRERSSSSAR